MKVKFSTWNMAYWSHKGYSNEAWKYFTTGLDCDILLFQEANPDLNVLDEKHLVWNEIGGKRNWGSGIYCPKWKIKEYSFNNNFPGAVTAAEIEVTKDFKPIVISLYGLFETINNTSYSIPNLHRIFSDLTGILEGKDTKNRVILGGDLNASLQCDDQQIGYSHKIFFNRIENFGLVNCFANYFQDFVQTHRHSRSKIPWQNDYFFISKNLQSHLVECRVIDNEKVRKLSDHNPVIITLDI